MCIFQMSQELSSRLRLISFRIEVALLHHCITLLTPNYTFIKKDHRYTVVKSNKEQLGVGECLCHVRNEPPVHKHTN